MSVVRTSAARTTLSDRLVNGVIAGIVGGIVFGVMMGMMGMLSMVAGLVGSSSAVVGFLVHIVISAIIGAGYGLLFGGVTTGWGAALGWGALYGVIWWFLGPLLIMPTMMGMGPQLTPAGMSGAIPSLIGHIVYGVVTGATFLWLVRR